MRSYMVALCLLFIALGHPSFAQKSSAVAGQGEESVVRVSEGAPLTVECPLRVEQRAEWRLDGHAPPADLRPAGESPQAGGGARLATSLHAPAAAPHHVGLYTCSRDPTAHRVRVQLLPAVAHRNVNGGSETVTPEPTLAPADADAPVVYFELNRHFTLNCTGSDRINKFITSYVWQKNGTDVETIPELKGRYKVEEGGARFELTARATEDDFGNYSCLVNEQRKHALTWRLHAHPVARMPANSNVVQGQKLKLTCKIIGKPLPVVDWIYVKPGEDTNRTAVEMALGERAVIAQSAAGVPRGELTVEEASLDDAGIYECVPRGEGGISARTVLRVKDKYAALWPFLGICAEVFILCAIILVYEKRRTKPELDDSDTDNHEQKKT